MGSDLCATWSSGYEVVAPNPYRTPSSGLQETAGVAHGLSERVPEFRELFMLS